MTKSEITKFEIGSDKGQNYYQTNCNQNMLSIVTSKFAEHYYFKNPVANGFRKVTVSV